ncbi:MAG: hypothetical protein WA755_05800 [Candidatus Acidiferrales bacterium]
MENLERVVWFGAGIVLGTVLTVSYDFERFIPMAAAFGFLCFISGVLLMQFFGLRKQEQKSLEEELRWLTESAKSAKGWEELKKEWKELKKEREEWQAERERGNEDPEKDT